MIGGCNCEGARVFRWWWGGVLRDEAGLMGTLFERPLWIDEIRTACKFEGLYQPSRHRPEAAPERRGMVIKSPNPAVMMGGWTI